MICAYHRYTEVGTNSTNSHHVHLQTIDQPVHHIHHSAWDLCVWTLAPPNSSNTQTSKQLNNQLCPCEVMAWCEFHAPPSPEFVNPQQNGKIIDTTRMRSTLKKIIQQENHWHKKKNLWIFRTCHPVPEQNLTYKWLVDQPTEAVEVLPLAPPARVENTLGTVLGPHWDWGLRRSRKSMAQ